MLEEIIDKLSDAEALLYSMRQTVEEVITTGTSTMNAMTTSHQLYEIEQAINRQWNELKEYYEQTHDEPLNGGE